MALSVERASATILRHVVARSRGRRPIYPDAGARAKTARLLGDCCRRHRLKCLVWCVTERSLHAVFRGTAASIALATEELLGAQLRHGHCLSTIVNADIYLLEVARHVLEAPVRAGHCRRVIDWPCSSARETLGLAAAPPWLDPAPLHDLLGPRDGQGALRLRRFMEN